MRKLPLLELTFPDEAQSSLGTQIQAAVGSLWFFSTPDQTPLGNVRRTASEIGSPIQNM